MISSGLPIWFADLATFVDRRWPRVEDGSKLQVGRKYSLESGQSRSDCQLLFPRSVCLLLLLFALYLSLF